MAHDCGQREDSQLYKTATRPVVTRRQLLRLASLPIAAALVSGCTGTTASSGTEEWRFPVTDPLYASLAANASQVFLSTTKGLFALDLQSGTLAWRFPSGEEYPNPPVTVDELVYIICETNAKLYALDAASGKQVWNFSLDGYILSGLLADKSAVYISATGDNGSVVQTFALNAHSGESLWDVEAGYPELVTDNTIYVTDDSSLFTLDKQSGQQRWSFDAPGGNTLRGSPLVSDGSCYVTYDDGLSLSQSFVTALDQETGATQWTASVPGGPPVVLGVTSGLLCATGSGGSALALDVRTGTVAWTSAISVSNMGTTAAVTEGTLLVSGTPPAADGGVLSAGGLHGETRLCAVASSNGKLKWQASTPGAWITGTPITVGDMVVAGYYGVSVRAVDLKTGKGVWSAPIQAIQGPIQAGDFLLAIGANVPTEESSVSSEGALYALRS